MPAPQKRIRKAVFPVAGLGTRFLPATKAMPKEMLTVVDRPVIQHVVDEARSAGIEHFVFVTGRNKPSIEEHFDQPARARSARSPSAARRRSWRSSLKDLPAAGATSFTRQQAPLGLGHAVWCARDIVGDEPFALLLPDMLHHGGKGVPRRDDRGLQRARRQPHRRLAGAGERDAPVRHRRRREIAKAKVSRITQMVEKPKQGTAPSNLHITGRYILQPEIFDILATQERGAGGEIQLTDAMLAMQKAGKPYHAVRFDGTIYDTGTKIGFLLANVAYGLERDDLAPALKAGIAKLV